MTHIIWLEPTWIVVSLTFSDPSRNHWFSVRFSSSYLEDDGSEERGGEFWLFKIYHAERIVWFLKISTDSFQTAVQHNIFSWFSSRLKCNFDVHWADENEGVAGWSDQVLGKTFDMITFFIEHMIWSILHIIWAVQVISIVKCSEVAMPKLLILFQSQIWNQSFMRRKWKPSTNKLHLNCLHHIVNLVIYNYAYQKTHKLSFDVVKSSRPSKKARPRFELGISSLLVRRFNQLSHRAVLPLNCEILYKLNANYYCYHDQIW